MANNAYAIFGGDHKLITLDTDPEYKISITLESENRYRIIIPYPENVFLFICEESISNDFKGELTPWGNRDIMKKITLQTRIVSSIMPVASSNKFYKTKVIQIVLSKDLINRSYIVTGHPGMAHGKVTTIVLSSFLDSHKP